MFRIYVLAIASFAVAAVGAVALDRTAVRADWDEDAPVTKTLDQENAPLADRFFHVEWTLTPGSRNQSEIVGYVYNDYGEAAVNIRLRIAELDAAGREVAYAIWPIDDTVPGFGRAYFDARVPESQSYRVTVASFEFAESQ